MPTLISKKKAKQSGTRKSGTSNRPNHKWVSYCPECGEEVKTGVESRKCICSKKHFWEPKFG